MKISGFTIIRNGVLLDYPFKESILSALPLVDEFIVVVGDSTDGTREKVESIGSEKIRIIDTVWDPEKRKNGSILADQTNIGLRHITGDWGVYLQADEVLHEKDISMLKAAMLQYNNDQTIRGFLLDYYHFWGYDHVCVSRRTYRREIRIVRNMPGIYSYNDAQGFRKYTSPEAAEKQLKGEKLQVLYLKGPHIYAYSRVREPHLEMEKVKHIARYWHDDQWIEQKYKDTKEWNYGEVDVIHPFHSSGHPAVMQQRAANATWKVEAGKPKFRSFKDRISHIIESLTGWRIGEYRNYIIRKKASGISGRQEI